MAATAIYVSAPGKVILCGEHAVVHGRSALAMSLGLRTFVQLAPSPGTATVTLDLPDIGIHAAWPVADLRILQRTLFADNAPDDTPVDARVVQALEAFTQSDGTARSLATMSFAYLFAALALDGLDGAKSEGAMVAVQSALPIGAGLGSSAAMATALATTLLLWQVRYLPDAPPVTAALINRWAYRSEQLVHGTPSGLDNCTSTYGGAIAFKGGPGGTVQRLPRAPTLRLLLTNTKVPRTTRALVARVRDNKALFPAVVDPVLDAIQGVTDGVQGLFDALADEAGPTDPVYHKFEALLRMNHHLLNSLGVGHSALDTVCRLTGDFELSSKLTGAGGGGCAITFLRPDTPVATVRAVRDALAARGFESFETEVGGPGVLQHGPPDDPTAPPARWPVLGTFP